MSWSGQHTISPYDCAYQLSFGLEMQLFPQNPLPAPHRTTGLQIITGNYRLTTARYRQITGIYMVFTINVYRYRRFTNKVGVFTHCRLPPVMKNYRHVGNAVISSCTSTSDPGRSDCGSNHVPWLFHHLIPNWLPVVFEHATRLSECAKYSLFCITLRVTSCTSFCRSLTNHIVGKYLST